MKKILFILVIIIFLPAAFYTGYQISSLTETEKLISQSYRQQLDAILFSVNQYCWDVVNSWSTKFNLFYIQRKRRSVRTDFKTFLTENNLVEVITIADSALKDYQFYTLNKNFSYNSELKRSFDIFFKHHPEVTQRLVRFIQQGYRKLEPIIGEQYDDSLTQLISFIFVTDKFEETGKFKFAALSVKVDDFISHVILPKIEEISGGRFYLTIYYRGQQFFSHPAAGSRDEKYALKKELWLLPDSYLGIRLQGETIEELARQRFHNNLFLIGLLDLILILAGWFLYRNLRREMELAKMKSNFVSNVSHELRTPLSLIRMYAETLDMNRITDEKKREKYYWIISQETERLSHLVNNILNFSRMEAGKKEYHLSEDDLNEIIKGVLESYRYHLENKGYSIHLDLDNNLSAVSLDREAVSEAFINLLDNAIKYSESEKKIVIRSGNENGTVYLEVEDFGIGISRVDQKKIFEKFYRVSNELVHKVKGSGLGLSLVKHIMQAHGGDIVVSSRKGEGSRFRLIFPVGKKA